MPWLGALLYNLLGSAIGSMLLGAGMGVATYAIAKPVVMSFLSEIASEFNNIAADILQVMLMAGLGEAVTIIGSAITTRLGITAARVMVVRRAG